MMSAKRRFIVLAFAAAAGLAGWAARGALPYKLPGVDPYQVACSKVDPTTVEGFVTNAGPVVLIVSGTVRFRFTVQNFMSRASVDIRADARIPPGSTVSIGRARVSEILRPGEACEIDVSEAIR
ncbi:MAG: hypothetical protein PHS14_11490 [Elusimicrobia bacterium]|nr:hypothetical protein [Elusimicrobiota bacterium]